MADLSHWDLADTFTGREAAYLMMGVDPSGPDAERTNADRTLDELQSAYNGALDRAYYAVHKYLMGRKYSNENDLKRGPACLVSLLLTAKLNISAYCLDPQILMDWLHTRNHDVQNEEFSRDELARWVRENNVPSIYRFGLGASVPATPSASGATVPQAATTAQGTADDTPAATAVPNSRERNTLLRIIGGLAMATYKMNIHGRMDGITEILDDLAQHGVTVSEETLRGKLREAARLIDPPADNKG